jgi:hypothetical protein
MWCLDRQGRQLPYEPDDSFIIFFMVSLPFCARSFTDLGRCRLDFIVRDEADFRLSQKM